MTSSTLAHEMTDVQRELARHALGLPNRNNRSNRNRFVTGMGGSDHEHWMALVGAGLAWRRDGNTLPFGGDDLFGLTLDGARAAKRRNEGLCPRDFPTGATTKKANTQGAA